MELEPILVDTDVCLDSLAGRTPWNIDANRIFHSSVEGTTDLVVSGLTFSNLFYLLGKAHGAKKMAQKLSLMRDLVSVSSVDQDIVDSALSAGWTDFEDALQYYSAVRAGCGVLITRNVSDYKKADNLRILSPSNFVSGYLV